MPELTPQERLVLIFVGAVVFLGVGLNFYRKSLIPLDIRSIIEQQKNNSSLNLNKANLTALSKIPAIGPALAEAIIDCRNRFGPFKSLEELKLVKGINQSRFNQIKSFFYFE